MKDLVRRHADLQGVETLFAAFVCDLGLVALLAVLYYRAVEVVVVHLKENVVARVGEVEHPLQAMTLGEHGGENKCARRRRDAVGHEVAALPSERAFVLLPACRVIPFGHAAGRER